MEIKNTVGMKEVFSPYFTDRNGVRHYKGNGVYHFWVKDHQLDGQMSFLEDVPVTQNPREN